MAGDHSTLKIQLYNILRRRFDEEELRTLCANLGVQYDDLRAEGHVGKARELVAYFDRRGQAEILQRAMESMRPDLLNPVMRRFRTGPLSVNDQIIYRRYLVDHAARTSGRQELLLIALSVQAALQLVMFLMLLSVVR